MVRAGIAELKAHLSEYLERVKAGEVVIIIKGTTRARRHLRGRIRHRAT